MYYIPSDSSVKMPRWPHIAKYLHAPLSIIHVVSALAVDGPANIRNAWPACMRPAIEPTMFAGQSYGC